MSQEEYRVYEEATGVVWNVTPPTLKTAVRECALAGPGHIAATRREGEMLSNAWAHGRFAGASKETKMTENDWATTAHECPRCGDVHIPPITPEPLGEVELLRQQLVMARDAWSRYDRLGGRVQDAQELDAALDLKFEHSAASTSSESGASDD